MKLSDYVVLGSTIVQLDSSIFLQGGCGCLIGMAAAAKTGKLSMFASEPINEFPWLSVTRHVDCPFCGASMTSYAGTVSCVAAHLEQQEIDFEWALDYIRSIEPAEEVAEETAVEEAYA